MKYTGFDIGGTKCAVCIGDASGSEIKIIDKKVIPQDHNVSAYKMIDRMCSLAEGMTDNFGSVGISCGGPLDSQNGVIMSPPNLPGWDDIKICQYINKRWGCKVRIQNDANACAVAEWKYGAGRGCRNIIFLTFGTGLGAGLILDGRLYSGTNDMAGEVGHIRLSDTGPSGYGKSGSFEGFCSGGGIAQIGRAMAKKAFDCGKDVSYCRDISQLEFVTAGKIAEYASKGFEDAREVYRISGAKLGYGLSILIDILNPERVIIGSIFQRSEELLRESMEEVIQKESLFYSKNVCKVVPAELKENIGDYAAIAVAAME